MANIHTVTLPDGTTAKRTSVNRTYTHAVAVHYQVIDRTWKTVTNGDGCTNQVVDYRDTGRSCWTALCWAGSLALAQKAAVSASRPFRQVHEVRIIPCTVTTKTPKRRLAITSRFPGYASVTFAGRTLGRVRPMDQDQDGTKLVVIVYMPNPNADRVQELVPTVADGLRQILADHTAALLADGVDQATIDAAAARAAKL